MLTFKMLLNMVSADIPQALYDEYIKIVEEDQADTESPPKLSECIDAVVSSNRLRIISEYKNKTGKDVREGFQNSQEIIEFARYLLSCYETIVEEIVKEIREGKENQEGLVANLYELYKLVYPVYLALELLKEN